MSFLDKLNSVFSSNALPAMALPCLLCSFFCVCNAAAQSNSIPGTPTAPFPTIENLSIVWPIAGDDNNNGVVAVRYRKSGYSDWIESAPLRRVPAGANAGFSWRNKHAGSIVNVEADTSYEIELMLADPDGGSVTRTLSASTRPWPESGLQGTVVTPTTIATAIARWPNVFLPQRRLQCRLSGVQVATVERRRCALPQYGRQSG